MRRRIRPDQLRLGMYVQGFEGAWMDHPFWRQRFLLEDQKDLVRARDSGIAAVWIDTELGRDVDPEPGAPAEAGRAAAPEPGPEASGPTPDAKALPLPAGMSEELGRAASICLSASEQVTALFNEARMGRALDTTSVKSLVNDIADSVLRNGHALISLARLKTVDNYTYMHSVAVCALMVSLARQLQLPMAQVRAAGFAGLVHDIGKAAVPLEILNKPGRLSDEEFAQVKAHARLGWEMLSAGGVTDADALDVCLHHHERMDGTGYPERLAGENISLMARMGAVCDVYDAITSNRPYKAGWDPAESLSRMAQWAGGHFDPRVFQAFVRSLGIYPVGSLVLLSTGRLAVVVEQSAASLLKPIVKAFFSIRHQERIPPQLIDLSAPGTRAQIVRREDPADWSFPDLDEIWSGDLSRKLV